MKITNQQRKLVKKHTAWKDVETFLNSYPTLLPNIEGGQELRELWGKHNGRENLFPRDR